MSGSLRKLKRQRDRDAEELSSAQQKLPTGRLVTAPVKGQFACFPVYGTIAMRDRDQIPLVMLVVALLGGDVEEGLKGLLEIELPLYVETETATVACLERYGWSGRIWKEGDAHWPTGDDGAFEQLRGFMAEAGLQASLTFPPDPETGNHHAQSVEVTRAAGRFLMPPLEVPTEPPGEDRVKAFRDIVRGYHDFYRREPADAVPVVAGLSD